MTKTSAVSTPSYERNVNTEPYLDLVAEGSPGFGKLEKAPKGQVKWMGGDHELGPWIYWVQRPAGDLIPPHKHRAGRVEFVVRGAIEWFEGDEAVAWWRSEARERQGRRYDAGSLTWVPAGTVYGYKIVEDTDVLLWFDASPGGTEWAR